MPVPGICTEGSLTVQCKCTVTRRSPLCTCTKRLMVCKSFKMLCNANFTYGFIEDQEFGTENLTCWHRRWQG